MVSATMLACSVHIAVTVLTALVLELGLEVVEEVVEVVEVLVVS
jgi:hypothetical protein